MTDEKSAKPATNKSTPGISASISLTESSAKTSSKTSDKKKPNADNNSPTSTHVMKSTPSTKTAQRTTSSASSP